MPIKLDVFIIFIKRYRTHILYKTIIYKVTGEIKTSI